MPLLATILGFVLALCAIFNGRMLPGLAIAGAGAFAVLVLGIETGFSIADNAMKEGFAAAGFVTAKLAVLAAATWMISESALPQKLLFRACEEAGNRGLRWGLPLHTSLSTAVILVAFPLGAALTSVGAALLLVPLVRVVCTLCGIPVLPLFSGVLAAVNLGGYAAGSSDAANLAERQIWGLNVHYYIHSLPGNLGALLVIVLVTFFQGRRNHPLFSDVRARRILQNFAEARRNREVDLRNAIVGLAALGFAVAGESLLHLGKWPAIAVSLLIILVGGAKQDRLTAISSIGLDVYCAVAGAYIFASAVSHPTLGAAGYLSQVFSMVHHDVGILMLVAFSGTVASEGTTAMLNIAPVCAAAVSIAPAAHAVGAAVLAGSIGVASASPTGLLLVDLTRASPESGRVTFKGHFAYGMPLALVLLTYYLVLLRLG